MGMGALTWGDVPPPTGNALDAANKGALTGMDLGQKAATFDALRRVHLDDPASMNRSIDALVHAGKADVAEAMLALSASRTLNSSVLPVISGAFSKVGALQSPPTTQTAPAPASDGTMMPSNQEHVDSLAARASAARDDLRATTDPQERATKAAAYKQEFMQAGVPEAAIDHELGDLSDGHFQTMGDYHASIAPHVGSVYTDAAAPGPMPAHPLSSNGSVLPPWVESQTNDATLNNPLVQAGLKHYGFDIMPQLARADAFRMPAVQEQAKADFAGQTKLAQNVADLETNPTRLTQEATGAGQKALQEKLVALGLDPAIAGKVAAAQAAATAPYHQVEQTGPRGEPTYQSETEFAAQHGGPPVAPGVTSVGPTHGAVPGAVAANTDAAKASAAQLAADRQDQSGSGQRIAVLREVNALLNSPQGQTGPGTQTVNGWRNFLLAHAPDLAAMTNGSVTEARLRAATQDELKKYMTQVSSAAAAQFGPGTDQKLAVAASGNANPDLSNLANRDVTRMNLALERAKQARLAAWGNRSDAENYGDFVANWNRTIDPRSFMLDLLSKDERSRLLGSITNDAEKAAFLRGKRAAVAAGLFTDADIPR